MGHDSKTKYVAITSVRRGATLREAGREAGASHESVRRWCRAEGICFSRGGTGGAILPRKRSSRGGAARLGLPQRLAISMGIDGGHSHERIARAIGFSRSTVSREISRHSDGSGAYDPYAAQMAADRSASRPKARKVDASRRLRAYVLGKLRLRFSPRQISKQIERDFPDDEEMRVSHEAVYQALYVQGRGALRQELKLEKALRSGRRARLPQSRLAARRGASKSWVEGCEISLRPAEAEDRAVPGHWEGDLVIGGDAKSCLITLVERSTRFALVRRLDLHPSELVASKLSEMVSAVPEALMRTITWDQGAEMALHRRFTDETGVKVYFCDPHSPWQRGTNENTNGLIRDYYPKGTDFTKVADEEIRRMQDQLNIRPRETLGWRSPSEVFAELLREKA